MSHTTTPINTGSGANIAVDNVTGVGLIQRVKIVDGSEGGSDGVPGNETTGLLVTPVSLPEIDPRQDYAHIGGSAKEIKWAAVSLGSGDNTVIAASGTIKYRVLSLFVVPDNDYVLTVKSDASTRFAINLQAYRQTDMNPHRGYVVETDAGDALVLSLDAGSAGAVQGYCCYVEN